jgi:membrane-bound serine protease (ClpP class)
VPLIVGLICLGLFFFGHHVARLAGWEEIVLFGVGAALIAVEVVAPGHVVPAVVGALLIVAALVMAIVNLEHVPADVAWDAGWLPGALARVFGSITATAVLAVGAGRILPRTRFGRRLILDTAIRAVAIPPVDPDAGEASLAGGAGTAATDLRPSGKVLLDGRRVEAVAERGYIDAGAPVRVVRRAAGRLVVRRIDRAEG